MNILSTPGIYDRILKELHSLHVRGHNPKAILLDHSEFDELRSSRAWQNVERHDDRFLVPGAGRACDMTIDVLDLRRKDLAMRRGAPDVQRFLVHYKIQGIPLFVVPKTSSYELI